MLPRATTHPRPLRCLQPLTIEWQRLELVLRLQILCSPDLMVQLANVLAPAQSYRRRSHTQATAQAPEVNSHPIPGSESL